MNYALLVLQGIIERGLIFSILIIGMYISSKVIKFQNLSVEGAFGLGGAVSVVLLNAQYNSYFVFLITFLVSGFSGVITGWLHQKIKINKMMSGIVVTTGIFSIILKIAGSNVILKSKNTIFVSLESLFSIDCHLAPILIISLGIVLLIREILDTEVGLVLFAVGDNPQMVLNISKKPEMYILLGLFLSNGLAGLSHALFVQYMGYFSIWFSAGILVIGLAGLILSDIFMKKFNYFVLLGGVIYQLIISLTFEFQIHPDWNRLITALLIIIILFMKKHGEQYATIERE